MEGILPQLKSAMVIISTESGSERGFIIDFNRGIIVTHSDVLMDRNVGEAVLIDKQEIQVFPVYGDPVYDFGFLGYNPDMVEYLILEEEISLALCIKNLMEAKDGKEFARKYRVPPLDRVNRALTFIQHNKDLSGYGWEPVNVPRGTLHVSFLLKSFDEALKLGLKWESQQLVKLASPAGENGMLVVESVAQDDTAYDGLKPGDFILKVNGEIITRLIKLETILDDHVGQSIEIMIEREGKLLTVNLLVFRLELLPVNVVCQDASPLGTSSSNISIAEAEPGAGLKCHICGEKSLVFGSFYALKNHINEKPHRGKKQKKAQKN